MTMPMTIHALAEAAGVKVTTIRYYERRGLMPSPRRTPAGYRQYGQSAVDRLRFIKRAQELGFSLEEIDDLLALNVSDPSACQRVAEATVAKLNDIDGKLRDLERLRGVLAGLAQACQQRQRTTECPVLAMLEERDSE